MSSPSPWAGVWIAEDIELIAHGVRTGSWVDGSLGVVSAGLDGLALVSDPVGALLQYGVAWLIEHVKPLAEALDWLAGDPAQIATHAQTWRTAAGSLAAEADELGRSVRWDVAEWSGSAAVAYRGWADRREQALRALGRASETMALITEGAGVLIGTVRTMVRDAVATVVSRLAVYAAELVATAGLAAPLVAEQVAAVCAAWGARIARWLRALIRSLRQLLSESRRLGELIKILRRQEKSGSGGERFSDHDPQPIPLSKEPDLEDLRVRELGQDPATKQFRPNEAETAVRIEHERDVTLIRAPAGHRADWLDQSGRSYDAVGNFPAQFFERQWPRLSEQIQLHLKKADFVPVDVSTFSAEQVTRIERFIAEKGLAPRVFIVGR